METTDLPGLTLSNRGRQLQGVCAGLAEHYGLSVWSVRLGFLALAVVGTWQAYALYLFLGLAMPWGEGERRDWLRFRIARWFGRTFARVTA
jgi:phage shock protein PspC (stress-responsive transcriptional regulator)